MNSCGAFSVTRASRRPSTSICSLETTQASEIFTDIVRQRLDFKPERRDMDTRLQPSAPRHRQPSPRPARRHVGQAAIAADRGMAGMPIASGGQQACRPAQRLQARRGGKSSCPRQPGRHRQPLWFVPGLSSAQRTARPGQGRDDPRHARQRERVHRRTAGRVRSVTVWNSVYKLRRAAQLIAPGS